MLASQEDRVARPDVIQTGPGGRTFRLHHGSGKKGNLKRKLSKCEEKQVFNVRLSEKQTQMPLFCSLEYKGGPPKIPWNYLSLM